MLGVMPSIENTMNIFLKLKHWQLFILMILPFFMSQLIAFNTSGIKWFGGVTIIWSLIFFGWIYSIGINSNKKLPNEHMKKTILFKLGFIVALTYMALTTFIILPNINITKQPEPFPLWAVPLHLASMLGIFYGLWFTAKQFSTLKYGKPVKFIDFSGPFFLLWFAPLGVWFLQPDVNKLLNE